MNKRTLITTAVAVFAAGSFASTAFAAGVHCGGTNACKGQGFTEASDAKDCTTKGGKVM